LLNSIKNTPFLIIGLSILLLIIISFLPKNIKVVGIPIKPVDLFMDVKPDSLLNYLDKFQIPGLKQNDTSFNC
jgi:hypothetical protein